MKKVSETKNVFELFSLKGKVAVVTGAASGIGQAIAVAFAEAGADVVGTWNNKPIDETKAAVEATGQKFMAVKIDLGDVDHVESLITKTIDKFGRIDILVNNAGITNYVPIEERTYESYQKIINVNLNSAYKLAREACLQMKKLGIKGRVINVSSTGGVNAGSAGIAPYVISKHGMLGITHQLAFEFSKFGITVNEIAPGLIDTPIHYGTPFDIEKAGDFIAQTIPSGRCGQAEDFKGIAVLLASDASSYIIGQRIIVDGGILLT